MSNQQLIKIPRHRFSHPQRNLPTQSNNKSNENYFTLAFTRAYFSNISKIHNKSKKDQFSFLREVPVNGFGIADLICIAWEKKYNRRKLRSAEDFIRVAKPTIRAFETKLSDWKKAIIQANRYRYYSNISTVVLPLENCSAALKYLESFKKIKVGLWGFDINTNHIVCYYTPRRSLPIAPRHSIDVLNKINHENRSLPIL